MKELWELITGEKQKTGLYYDKESECPIPEGLYHRAVEVWVVNHNNEILLTQRHPSCKEYGFKWECARGAVRAGENCEKGAVRELFEKTGIVADAEELLYLGETVYEDRFMESYLYYMDDPDFILHLQPNEAIEARYASLEVMDDLEEEIVPKVWERYQKYRGILLQCL